jgi:hypothetical protein
MVRIGEEQFMARERAPDKQKRGNHQHLYHRKHAIRVLPDAAYTYFTKTFSNFKMSQGFTAHV